MPHGPSIAQVPGATKAPWITADNLARIPELVHGFGTRAQGDQKAAGAERSWLHGFTAHQLLLLRQVHGTQVVDPGSPPAFAPPPSADAWAGVAPEGTLLGILTADCLPVIFCHPQSRRLAIAHAGWRGAAGGIVYTTLAALDAPLPEIQVALGPCIGPCCYQVGDEVATATGGGPHLFPCPTDTARYRLDLPQLVRSQLLRAGLQPGQIESCTPCTACHPELFYSHRRRREPQRMVSVVGWEARAAGASEGRPG